MVDPSIQNLNRFTDNVGKIEALSAEIASILRESKQGAKPLTIKDETPWLPSRPARARSTASKSRSPKHRGVKLRKGTSPRRKADTEGGVRPPAIDSAPQLLRVSPRLFSKYNREEVYEKVWKAPIQEVAEDYGVTDFTLRKTCERLWIPVPNRGYWARKAAGQPVVSPPPLPQVAVSRKVKKATGTNS